MKLRNKVLMAVTIVWALFAVIVYMGSNYFLINSFLTLERDRANRDLARVDEALNQNLHSLYTFTADWAHWNDLYNYMDGKNPQFIANNLTMAAYINSNINLLTYWDLNGNLVVGVAIDTLKKKVVAFPKGINNYIYPGSALLNRKDVNQDLKGFILLPDGIMLVAAAAVSDGEKLKNPLGALVTGRFLSVELIKEFEEITRLRLELFTLEQIGNNPALQRFFKEATHNNGHISRPVDRQTLHGYSLIRDINNKPIGMFRMTGPRNIYLTGEKSVHYFLISILLLGILFVLLISWLLRVLIVKRLERLDRDVADISTNNELTRRVDQSGKDELASVSKQINKMLDIIQSSHEKLEHRVDKRTRELQKTNIQLQQEITERKTIENELIKHKEYLARIAHYDGLTSLPNRVLFNEMLNEKLKTAIKQNEKFAILFMDLDRFKTINDALGHPVGDLVLKEISQRMVSILGNKNVLARLGGDEFIIMINENVERDHINRYAKKILDVCSKKITISSHDFYITASIGISMFPEDGHTLEDLQKNADMAMYKSKHSGGSNFQYYTEDMNTEAHERIRLDAELRKALQNKEFVLFYQPKINIVTGEMIGVEALIRWQHPEMGIISPSKFIHLAEETGSILPLGEWVLKEACRANKSWQDKGYKPISVAVNISPKQFAHQDITHMVASVLAETDLDPAYLELEITESAVMENVDVAATKLNLVKDMGVKVSIDDFGTGYTSINYLKQFPVSCLKIDQNFVRGVPNNQNDLSIIIAVIALAHSLNMKVVAEGVETGDQFQWLADNNCDIVQGYFLSRPLPESKLILELISEYAEDKPVPA